MERSCRTLRRVSRVRSTSLHSGRGGDALSDWAMTNAIYGLEGSWKTVWRQQKGREVVRRSLKGIEGLKPFV